jgi:hypothetical protein
MIVKGSLFFVGGLREVFHARQSFEMLILRPKHRAVRLCGGVDQAIGEGQVIAKRFKC